MTLADWENQGVGRNCGPAQRLHLSFDAVVRCLMQLQQNRERASPRSRSHCFGLVLLPLHWLMRRLKSSPLKGPQQ